MATIDVKCRFCNKPYDVKKHGTGCGYHQRYRCQFCRKTFQIDYTYRACKPGIKEQIVDLAMNNAGIAKRLNFDYIMWTENKLSTSHPLALFFFLLVPICVRSDSDQANMQESIQPNALRR